MGRMNWRWKGREMEEVREFKYLGYTIGLYHYKRMADKRRM